MTKDTIDLSQFAKLAKTNSKQARNSLGRGLSALLGEGNYTQTNIDDSELSSIKVVRIEIDKCIPSAYQARKDFNEDSLQELSNSIKEKGVLQPIILRKSEEYPDKYEIVAGERRCKASKIANLIDIPAIIMTLSNKEVMEIGLIENLQRKNLNAVEEAMAYSSLYNDFGYTHDQIANTLGKSRSYITNYLRILNLPTEVLDLVIAGDLSFGHAKMLVNVENPIELANKIVNNSLSVKDTETLSKQQKDKNKIEKKIKQPSLGKEPNPELIDWSNKINSHYNNLKLSFTVKDNTSGEIKIKYKNFEELKELLKNI